MLTPLPPQRLPHDLSPPQRQYLRRTHEQLENLSRYEGVGISGGTMPTDVPDPLVFIYGIIRDEEAGSGSGGSGAGSGHGSFSLSPIGVGFTDEEGYLAYAFDQIYDAYPWKGTILENGISTTLPTATRDGANYAYPLNNDFFDSGVRVILKKAGKHWVIIGAISEDGSGSGSGNRTYYGTCPDGSFFYVRINGTSITVGDATHG